MFSAEKYGIKEPDFSDIHKFSEEEIKKARQEAFSTEASDRHITQIITGEIKDFLIDASVVEIHNPNGSKSSYSKSFYDYCVETGYFARHPEIKKYFGSVPDVCQIIDFMLYVDRNEAYEDVYTDCDTALKDYIEREYEVSIQDMIIKTEQVVKDILTGKLIADCRGLNVNNYAIKSGIAEPGDE